MIKVFIENEAGSNEKNIYNEKSLEYKKTVIVSKKYPYPYGFILKTTSGDGDNLDCFILTNKNIKSGEIVECEPVGVMLQYEDGEKDHNIVAVPIGEDGAINEIIKERLNDFVMHVFEHLEGKKIEVGGFLGRREAMKLIKQCMDENF